MFQSKESNIKCIYKNLSGFHMHQKLFLETKMVDGVTARDV